MSGRERKCQCICACVCFGAEPADGFTFAKWISINFPRVLGTSLLRAGFVMMWGEPRCFLSRFEELSDVFQERIRVLQLWFIDVQILLEL